MPMLADTVELVIGVDTHTAAVVQAVSGAVVDQVTVPATPAGYQQLLRFADRQDGRRVWAIEPPAATAPSTTRWTRSGRPVRPWAATSSPSLVPPASGRRCRCGWPPGVRRSRPPPTPNASSTLVVAAPDPLRGRLRQQAHWDTETCATAASLRALAHRIQLLNSEAAEHTRAMLGRPHPCLQRPDGPGSAQPIRRPPAQPGPAPSRPDQAAL
jgi:transposase